MEHQKTKKCSRSGRFRKNMELVRTSVVEDPNLSINEHSRQVGLCTIATWRTVRYDLIVNVSKVELIPLNHSISHVFYEKHLHPR